MTLPIQQCYLVSTVALGVVHIAVNGFVATRERGFKWNLGPRDGQPKPLSVKASRLDRSFSNFMQTFSFFAVVSLLVIFNHLDNSIAQSGAALYFWSRIVYVPLYVFGLSPWRTVAWALSMVGLLMMVRSLGL